MKRIAACLLVQVILALTAQAAAFRFNASCKAAYHEIFALRLNTAAGLLEKEKQADRDNLIPYYLENYIDFLVLFIGEEKSQFLKREGNKEARIKKLSSGSKDSPFCLFTQAEVHLQWAFARIKFGEYATAGLEMRKAYKLLEENDLKFPGFKPNRKSLGLLHALIGTIPDQYRWAVSITGMSGSLRQGIDELREIGTGPGASSFLFREEALMYYAFLSLYFLNDEGEASGIAAGLHPGSLLNCFTAASIAMNSGKNEDALKILSERPAGKDYMPFPFLDYLLGLVRLQQLDFEAEESLTSFLINHRGQNYIKDARQKLAWIKLLQNDHDGYRNQMKLCLTEGNTNVDADKQAMKEALSGDAPDPLLLKCRLLFDGGYFTRAEELIKQTGYGSMKSLKDSLEYIYRYARIDHKLGKTDSAAGKYREAVALGKTSGYYYSANAALQLGLISEMAGDPLRAVYYYQLCLSMKGHEYKNSIDQKAKAGLQRVQ